MNRIDKVKEYVNAVVSNHCALPDKYELFAHLQGVSSACALLAIKRGLDVEVAAACGLMHDLYACRAGSYMQHGPSGAEMARVALRKMGCFDDAEQMNIRSAIYRHSDKQNVHGPYDELLKDADTLYPYLAEGGRVAPPRALRLRRLAEELGIPFTPETDDRNIRESQPGFSRHRLAAAAGELAARPTEGCMEDEVFQRILRYWPEEEAYAELRNAWCAAFVYHCCVEAGLELPIRHPLISIRFAGVGAWLEWANLCGFYFDGEDFQPEPGDIVIYDNVIPPDKKTADSPWHDHIGIVLAADSDTLDIAEGNAGNDNVSAIIRRSLYEHIGGFVRIPDGYVCDSASSL